MCVVRVSFGDYFDRTERSRCDGLQFGILPPSSEPLGATGTAPKDASSGKLATTGKVGVQAQAKTDGHAVMRADFTESGSAEKDR
jgi:hypothetical protein